MQTLSLYFRVYGNQGR